MVCSFSIMNTGILLFIVYTQLSGAELSKTQQHVSNNSDATSYINVEELVKAMEKDDEITTLFPSTEFSANVDTSTSFSTMYSDTSEQYFTESSLTSTTHDSNTPESYLTVVTPPSTNIPNHSYSPSMGKYANMQLAERASPPYYQNDKQLGGLQEPIDGYDDDISSLPQNTSSTTFTPPVHNSTTKSTVTQTSTSITESTVTHTPGITTNSSTGIYSNATTETTEKEETIPTVYPVTTDSPHNTTSSMHTTSTPAVPSFDIHKFSLKSGSAYCFLLQAEMAFEIYYYTEKSLKSLKFSQINAAKINNESECTEQYAILSLDVTPSNESGNHTWKLKFLFTRKPHNRSDGNGDAAAAAAAPSAYSFDKLQFNYSLDKNLFPDSLSPGRSVSLSNNVSVFEIPVGSYYSCISGNEFDFTESGNMPSSCKVHLKQFKVQAFMNNTYEVFYGNRRSCDLDTGVNNAVPIGVGVALIICIIVAVTIFVIFSRRNRRSYTTL
ncbi:unnamed protein product [Heterobilharzia americana]|nr:unnamed protein product [Heterobilharzia americana]